MRQSIYYILISDLIVKKNLIIYIFWQKREKVSNFLWDLYRKWNDHCLILKDNSVTSSAPWPLITIFISSSGNLFSIILKLISTFNSIFKNLFTYWLYEQNWTNVKTLVSAYRNLFLWEIFPESFLLSIFFNKVWPENIPSII